MQNPTWSATARGVTTRHTIWSASEMRGKTFIGQASGESYFLDFHDPQTIVVIQPSERTSGIDIGIDGHGGRPTRQDNRLFR